MQCKDVPDRPVLEFLRALDLNGGRWASLYDIGNDNSVQRAMSVGTPPKIALAKMRILIRRELVDGCACGCRGDFVLTAKGRAYLDERGQSA